MAQRIPRQAAAYQAQLEERTRQFDQATAEFESRHEVLRSLLEYAGGQTLQLAASRPIERDGARIIMAASIDEAEPRQSRAIASEPTKSPPLASAPVATGSRGRPGANALGA